MSNIRVSNIHRRQCSGNCWSLRAALYDFKVIPVIDFVGVSYEFLEAFSMSPVQVPLNVAIFRGSGRSGRRNGIKCWIDKVTQLLRGSSSSSCRFRSVDMAKPSP
jgi:hypothetical protein